MNTALKYPKLDLNINVKFKVSQGNPCRFKGSRSTLDTSYSNCHRPNKKEKNRKKNVESIKRKMTHYIEQIFNKINI